MSDNQQGLYLPPLNAPSSKCEWICATPLYLSVFLLVLLFAMTFLYANAITTMVYPQNIPKTYGSYGVEPGVNGNAYSPDTTFYVSGIEEATSICDLDNRCQLFYLDGRVMTYLLNDGKRYKNQTGGIYRRQIKLVDG